MMLGLEDKVVIVTGGAKGIGRAYVEAFVEAGARVAIADVDQPAAENLAAELTRNGHDVLSKGVNISNLSDCLTLTKATWDRWHRLDVLVNNAAVYATIERKPFTDITGDEWDQVMAVNLRGMLFCTQAVFPYMKQQRYGKIINISSSTIFNGSPNFLHYVTSKAGVVGFTRSLAREVGEDGIRVNAVAPGLTASGTNEKVTLPGRFEKAIMGRCLKRQEIPKDLVGSVLFLASSYSDFITGQLINVDGGGNFH